MRLTLTLSVQCADGYTRAWDRWLITCPTASAIRAVHKYLKEVARQMDGLIIPDSDISDPAA